MLLYALGFMMLATAAARIPVKEDVREGPKGNVFYVRGTLLSVNLRDCGLFYQSKTSFAKKHIAKIPSFVCSYSACHEI